MDKEKINVFVDCSAGAEECFVIPILINVLLKNKNINIIGISASYGKASIENSESNLLHIIKRFCLNERVDLYRGADEQLLQSEHDLIKYEELPLANNFTTAKYPRISGDILINKIRSIKNGKFMFISLNNLTCISNLLMQKPQLRTLIDKLLWTGVSFDHTKETNLLFDPNAANHILQDPLMKKKIVIFPMDFTANFQFGDAEGERLSYNELGKEKKNGVFKTELLTFAKRTNVKTVGNSAPLLVALFEYLGLSTESHNWEIEERKLLCTIEGEGKGKPITLKSIPHTKIKTNLLDIEQQEPLLVFGMDYEKGWKQLHSWIDTADLRLTKAKSPAFLSDYRMVIMLIVENAALLLK